MTRLALRIRLEQVVTQVIKEHQPLGQMDCGGADHSPCEYGGLNGCDHDCECSCHGDACQCFCHRQAPETAIAEETEALVQRLMDLFEEAG